MYGHSAVGILIDLLVFVTPLFVFWGQLQSLELKIKMSIVFGVGLFALIAGIIRLSIIVTVNMSKNTTWNIIVASLWTDIECHVGFMVACFPTLQPLIRKALVWIGLHSEVGSTYNRTRSTDLRVYDNISSNREQGSQSHRNAITGGLGGERDGGSMEKIISSGDIYKTTDIRVDVESGEITPPSRAGRSVLLD